MLEGKKSTYQSLHGTLQEGGERLEGHLTVSTRTLPYYEEENEYGTTVYIGEEAAV